MVCVFLRARRRGTMLIATAGHIDHGKTSLVRALTGADTDRLPEERRRGISIDLGFAYWMVDGQTIGFVDVPGHERFIRNMLAGVSAVDFALLVVAADDGVMPQTIEHAQILDMMGISRGAVAITKSDRADAGQITRVHSQVAALLARTGLSDAPIFEVASPTGHGIPALADFLRDAATRDRHAAPDRNFRLAIDRAFTVTGVGTVVTGTVVEGEVETGAKLVVSPQGIDVRVRGLQSAGRRTDRAGAGERCALNLVGVDVDQLHRGDWLVTPAMHAPTTRLEVRLKVQANRDQSLKHYTPAHVHIGTADIAARVLVAGQLSVAPGEEAVVQLVLEERTAAVTGDHLVLRDQSGRELLGGGRVIDPFVPGDRRRQIGRLPVSAALQTGEAASALAALLEIAGHEVNALQFQRSFNLTPSAVQNLFRDLIVLQIGKGVEVALPAGRVAAIENEVRALLATFHRDHPEAAGLTPREMRTRLSTPVSPEVFQALLKNLSERRLVDLAGTLVRLAGHTASVSVADAMLWQQLRPWLEDRGLQSFTAREAVAELRTTEAAVRALLYGRRSRGDIWRITDTRFLLRDQVLATAAAAAALSERSAPEGFSAAQFRDVIGTGRTLAIQILEFFDTLGLTRRRGDLRIMRNDYEDVIAGGISTPRPAIASDGIRS